MFVLSSCVYKRSFYTINSSISQKTLCILFPENPVVFEDLSRYVYTSLWDHFQRVGYNLSTTSSHAYRLRCVIRDVQSVEKLISPDVQPYGFRVMITIEYFLQDPQGRLLVTDTITRHHWMYKPENPLYSRDFIAFQYQQLCDSIPMCIDHVIRPLYISDKNETSHD